MDYLSVANHTFVYLIAAFVISVVALSTVIFIRLAWKRGLDIGMSKKVLIDTVKSSAIFSIGPTIPIAVSLIIMFPLLGIPWPWMRLSIIGTAPYELMTAEAGAMGMGVAGIGGGGYTSQVFAASTILMVLLPLDVMFFNLFFLKKYSNKLQEFRKRDSVWMAVLSHCLFLGLIAAFVGGEALKGGVALATLISSFVVIVIVGLLMRNEKLEWLKNYALVIGMTGGMACSVFFDKIL